MDRVALDSALDRVAASMSATLFVLCSAFALAIWWRIVFLRPAMLDRDTPAPLPPAMSDAEVKSVAAACAVAVSAFAVRYFQTAAVRFGHWRSGSFEYDLAALTADGLVLIAVLYSIRQATHTVCGATAVVLFATLALVSGCVAHVWA